MRYDDIFRRAKQQIMSIESEVMRLLPYGKREGREWICINPTRSDNNLGSFKVNLVSGKWSDFASGDAGGDIVSLLAYLEGVSQYEAALKIVGRRSNILIFPRKTAKVSKDKYIKALISKILAECMSSNSSPIEDYLRSRGYKDEIPPNILFHPRLYHSSSKSHYPAMVSVIHKWPDLEILGLHRTYLKTGDVGIVSKADISPNKMMLGSAGGGAVMISAIESDKPLIIAEGIETALSVYASTGIPSWAALSTSGMIKIVVPPVEELGQIIIAADSDAAGMNAAKLLATRLLGSGYKVKIAKPPSDGTDFNDLLLHAEGAI